MLFKVSPVFTCTKFIGMSPGSQLLNPRLSLPKKVPRKKIWIGIPAIGELRLTNQLGTSGVSLRKSMKVNKVDLFSSTFFTNL